MSITKVKIEKPFIDGFGAPHPYRLYAVNGGGDATETAQGTWIIRDWMDSRVAMVATEKEAAEILQTLPSAPPIPFYENLGWG